MFRSGPNLGAFIPNTSTHVGASKKCNQVMEPLLTPLDICERWKSGIRKCWRCPGSAVHCLVDWGWWRKRVRVNMKIKRFSEIVSALILDCQSRDSVSGICIRILRVGTRNHQSLTSITESDKFKLK